MIRAVLEWLSFAYEYFFASRASANLVGCQPALFDVETQRNENLHL
jgi:hypothetical protein